jgi:DNA polymerase-1
MNTPAGKLVLIDGHGLAFRAFHALSNTGMRATSGEPTYAVYGFMQSIFAMIQERQPDHVIVSFDVGRTFRHEQYAEYKAKRAETPEEFYPQLERIKQLLQALNVPIFTAEGFEADDVIGTLVGQAASEGLQTLILTGDSDILQLVDNHTSVQLVQSYGKKESSTLYNEEKVRERYRGLSPAQLADLRGLKGDASDNIPGVKGIGDKGAMTLLAQFGTVENLYGNLEQVDKRYRKHLEGQREQALFSKWLATIVRNAPVELDLAAATPYAYNRAEVLKLFQELGFRSLVERLPALRSGGQQDEQEKEEHPSPASGGAGESTRQLRMFDAGFPPTFEDNPAAHGSYHAVTSEETLREVVAALDAAPGFAFDTESSSLRPFESTLVGISLAIEAGTAWYIPLGHEQGTQLERGLVLERLRPLLADPHKPKYAHHARFDIEVLLQAGLETEGLAFDTMLAAALLGKRKGLKDLAFSELEKIMTDITDLIGKGSKQRSFATVPIEQAVPYAAADADMTLRLVERLGEELEREPEINALFHDVEMPLVPVLVEMERAGIRLDVEFLRQLGDKLGRDMARLEQEIHTLAGGPFNINSGHQLNDVLFGRLHLPTDDLSKTTTGRYSLTADALEKLSDSHEIVRSILNYRQLAKLKSTYVDALPKLVNPATGRVHTTFNQLGTATGRLASSSPNLQNVPVRTDIGSEVRRAFVADSGCLFISADYSQIELRVLAHITRDPNLVQAFLDDQDIHAATAAQLFNVPLDQVDKEQRRIAKTTVFGIIYGISSFGLAQRTSMTRQEAQALIDAFFGRFANVERYITTTLEQGRARGYVQSLFGRRREMPDLQQRGPRRQAAEREAINMPIQSTAADLMKMAMITVADTLKARRLNTRILLQVHDELILEAPREEAAEVRHLVRQAMEGVYRLEVPLKVDVEVGENWEHMEKEQVGER